MERSITDNASSPGNAGAKANATQANASGKRTFAFSTGSSPGMPNTKGSVTKGTVETSTNPGMADSAADVKDAGHNLGVLQGPGEDREKKFSVYTFPGPSVD